MTTKEKEEQELQKKYMTLQILKQQLNSLMEEKNSLNEKVTELTTTVKALKQLSEKDKDKEMWSTLGSGTFIRAEVKNTEKVLMAVGSGVVVEKPRAESIEVLTKKLQEMQELDKQLVLQINKFAEQAQKLEKELEHAVENR